MIKKSDTQRNSTIITYLHMLLGFLVAIGMIVIDHRLVEETFVLYKIIY